MRTPKQLPGPEVTREFDGIKYTLTGVVVVKRTETGIQFELPLPLRHSEILTVDKSYAYRWTPKI